MKGKESNILNSVNWKIPKMNKGERKEIKVKKEWGQNDRIIKYLSIITININELRSPIIRHGLDNCTEKISFNSLLTIKHTSLAKAQTKFEWRELSQASRVW
jgi:hypothetical protein